MNIGEKIKAERVNRHMTQQQLAGEQMTRNMVSQIESGRAMPSVESLFYLAQQLDVPVAYLVGDAPLFAYRKLSHADTIRQAYAQKRYRDCLFFLDKLKEYDDELHWLYALCALEEGKRTLFAGALVSASDFFRRAKEHMEHTIYPTEHILAQLQMYTALTENIRTPLLVFDEAVYRSILEAFLEAEFFHYLTMDMNYAYQDPIYAAHMEAKKLMRQKKHESAIPLLLGIEEYKNTEHYNAFVFFGVYTDLEMCYKETMNFEQAYRYSTKRISLMESFKS